MKKKSVSIVTIPFSQEEEMTSPTERRLEAIWAQERRDDEQNRRLAAYVSARSRVVLCGACERLVSERLNFTDEKGAIKGEECSICGEEG